MDDAVDVNPRTLDADVNTPRVRTERPRGVDPGRSLRERRTWYSNNPEGTERFYRAMSEKEYARVVETNGLVRRDAGSNYLGVTRNRDYAESLQTRRRGARSYPAVVEFEVRPGTERRLLDLGATHGSAADAYPGLPPFRSGMNAVQVKYEANRTLSFGLGSSPEGLSQFNDAIVRITRIR